MHIKSVHIKAFKRFTDLDIVDLPPSAKLVVLCGPNGSGKSSVFDAFSTWEVHGSGLGGMSIDKDYHHKQGVPFVEPRDLVAIDFHEPLPERNSDERRKLFYIRTSYRHDEEQNIERIQRPESPLKATKGAKLIQIDRKISENYQRLLADIISELYSGSNDQMIVGIFRDKLIGDIREPMRRLFADLVLDSLGHYTDRPAFFFKKISDANFHYKNLSGGEKAAFDIILDLIVKRNTFNDTIFCIDEPELHMNPRLQAKLLVEMVDSVPEKCQLWIATNSVGMMRQARDLHATAPDRVVFLDFQGKDFEAPVTLRPESVDRAFWKRTLTIALDDLASLVAPSRVVLCEGLPAPIGRKRADFDARCYRQIFAAEYPDTDFMSAGNADQVSADQLDVGQTIQALVPGTQLIRLIDRDQRTENQIKDAEAQGIRVLSKRHLESFLLEDEMLGKLCVLEGQPEKLTELLAEKEKAVERIVLEGKSRSDLKSAAGYIYTAARKLLSLEGYGTDSIAFLRDKMAPLVTRETKTYVELKRAVFGE